jgi:phage baseplate assembly protein W
MKEKFFGAPYPITRNPRGLLRTQNGVTQIKSDLLVLLLTNPGERVMLPGFGTPLRKLMFEQNDETVILMARQMIIDSIRTWEPRVTVQQLWVGFADDEDLNKNEEGSKEHILAIKIDFVDPENIKEVQNLTLEVPLAGSTNVPTDQSAPLGG